MHSDRGRHDPDAVNQSFCGIAFSDVAIIYRI